MTMAQTTIEKTVNLPFLPQAATIKHYPNGYTLVFVPKKGDVFNVSTWVKTGSLHEDEQNNGVSHFLEHLMFKGTERFKPGEFDRQMESMGAIINAATWKDYTFYYVTGPKGLPGEYSGRATESENFDRALDLHADMLLGSTIPEEEVGPQYNPDDPAYQGEKRERSVVIEEIGMREDQPWTKVYNALNHMMYPEGHPYQRDVIGTRQIIGNIPRTNIIDYYQRWYSSQNMTTIIVGDFDPATVEEKVLKYFDFSKRPSEGDKAMEKSPVCHSEAEKGKRYQEVKGEFTTSFFIMGYHGPDPKNLKETIALDIFNQVLTDSRNARLSQALIEKPDKPIFNYLGSGQSTYKLGNAFYIQGNYNIPDTKLALSQVSDELDKVLNKEPVTAEEFKNAIKKLKVNFAETSETASGIADTVGENLTVLGDLSHYTDYLTALDTITLDEVITTSRKYLSPDKLYTAVLLPQGS